jgi:hypothetical protein
MERYEWDVYVIIENTKNKQAIHGKMKTGGTL